MVRLHFATLLFVYICKGVERFTGFDASKTLGEVLVVPNPYRGDVYYTDGNGMEGREYDWSPEKRKVRFIHLPSRATIKIFTVAGEIVGTIEHDDHLGISGQEDFSLFSESGRPLAPGIFIFTVDSELGSQTGKFVVIK